MNQKFNEDWRKVFTDDSKGSKPVGSVQPVSSNVPKSITFLQPGQSPFGLSFVFGSNERKFTPYHHITIVEYHPEQSRLKISFASHYVELEGHKLDILYYEILNQRVLEVLEVESRYAAIMSEEVPQVFKITFHLHSVV